MVEAELICEHCGLPIAPGDLVVHRQDEIEHRFCCHGCLGAWTLIRESGLDSFYRRRDWRQPGVDRDVFQRRFDSEELASHVHPAGPDRASIHLLLDGIRCASCCWLVEKVLERTPGVIQARVNYGTHRLRIVFDPRQCEVTDLCRTIARLGYLPRPHTSDARRQGAARERRRTLYRFGTAVFLSMQLMGYSLALYAGYFQGMDPTARRLMQGLAAAVTTPVVFYCGWPFLAGAWRSLRNRQAGMDLLIALGVLAAYGYSLFAMLAGREVYFDTAAMIVTLILLGRLLETSARQRAAAGIDRLLSLAPERAMLITENGFREVASDSLRPGDLVLVAAGERFPTDGAVTEGESEIDASAVSGESQPVPKRPGDRIDAGTMNLTHTLKVRVTAASGESFIARVAALVEDAQSRRAPIQAMADRVAAVFVPLVVLVAATTFGYWALIAGDNRAGLLNAVSVLVVACPCALGLATPTAILVACGQAAARGILFRGGDILEQTGRIDLVAFDKTGTLTHGRPAVTGLYPLGGDETELLEAAARCESGSGHPLARAIVAEANRRGIHPPLEAGAETLPGLGVVLTGDRDEIRVGKAELAAPDTVIPGLSPDAGETVVFVSRNGRCLGAITLADDIRPEAADVIAGLRRAGIRTAILTGDREQTAHHVAAALGIDSVAAGMTPAQKAEWLDRQKQKGRRVMMVGDGINDAVALATADVGCAMSGGTDIALENSDLVLTRPDLRRLLLALRYGRDSLKIIRQNLAWAFCYNLLALPLAASGRLLPIFAAAAMAFSSVSVIGNSLRLLREGKDESTATKPEGSHA
ncbi:Cu2+-exporting ATPase [Geothermobacter ehrlichii]|uniref:Cu2+-exporting ATPase n=1 Tax=Geothermobacter ehrlichii TaxID=213224 RepID=A0A5D3WIL4_9BACT|nr:heavy metal translocating P-type ATPase [Geothermobacter ehrlichii]TYO98772.1 Cu2+-exporting ATPase [Geothermobacter ehrlichii]